MGSGPPPSFWYYRDNPVVITTTAAPWYTPYGGENPYRYPGWPAAPTAFPNPPPPPPPVGEALVVTMPSVFSTTAQVVYDGGETFYSPGAVTVVVTRTTFLESNMQAATQWGAITPVAQPEIPLETAPYTGEALQPLTDGTFPVETGLPNDGSYASNAPVPGPYITGAPYPDPNAGGNSYPYPNVGGYPNNPNQPYNQPNPNQPYPNQPYPTQPYNQPMPNEPFPQSQFGNPAQPQGYPPYQPNGAPPYQTEQPQPYPAPLDPVTVTVDLSPQSQPMPPPPVYSSPPFFNPSPQPPPESTTSTTTQLPTRYLPSNSRKTHPHNPGRDHRRPRRTNNHNPRLNGNSNRTVATPGRSRLHAHARKMDRYRRSIHRSLRGSGFDSSTVGW